jgi:uncharacterized membrane protein (DUF106 family)
MMEFIGVFVAGIIIGIIIAWPMKQEEPKKVVSQLREKNRVLQKKVLRLASVLIALKRREKELLTQLESIHDHHTT